MTEETRLYGQGAFIFALGVLVVLHVAKFARRITGAPPPADVAAIRAHLALASQEVESIKPMMFGGPWQQPRGRAFTPYQIGRPYRVVGRARDGGRWVHTLAMDGVDGAGDPRIREYANGFWSPR